MANLLSMHSFILLIQRRQQKSEFLIQPMKNAYPVYYIDRFLIVHNRLCETYHMLLDVQDRVVAVGNEANQDIPVVNMIFRRDRHSDQKLYNTPNQNEIAMILCQQHWKTPI